MTADPPSVLVKGGQPGTPGLAQRLITDRLGRRVTHWVRIKPAPVVTPQVSQRAKHYTEAQQELDFDREPYAHLPTRPATRPEQRQAGRDALAALKRRLDQLRAVGGPAATLLGSRLYADFQAAGQAQLVGQVVREPGDLAALAQVYRDPRFETFRIVYVRQNRIVGEAAYSSRLPGAVAFPPTIWGDVATDVKRFRADGYYVLHNHPSGHPQPSAADLYATRKLAQEVPGMRQHLVLDHHSYAVIAPSRSDPEAMPLWTEVQDQTLSGADYHAAPVLPHDVLGLQIGKPEDVKVVASLLRRNGEAGCPVLILTKGRDAQVELVCQAPLPALLDQQQTGRLPAILRSLGRMTGAGAHRFLIVRPEDLVTYGQDLATMVQQGWLTDIVPHYGDSLRQRVHPTKPDLMDPRHPGRRVA